ncbi:MAG TPA: hypothetical protein P5250_03890, partial [Bacteroidales bacterium]|nr:hypothetical protein [Bacteroidales bacterium]
VFGQEPDRYGKSVVCDLTLKPFLNEGPPYPVKYLFKKNINTKNNLSLTNNPNDDFTTKQLLITGFFIDNKLQSIISFDKQPVLYHYCSEQNNFVGSLLKLNDNIIQLSPNYSNIYTADINYDGLDEIIIYDKKYKSLFVLKVNMNNHSIYSKKFSASLSVILDSKNFNENIKLNNDANIYIADFDNDTKIELLVAENNGQWTMYKFINNNLLEISRGKLKYFDGSKYDLNVYCGNIKGLETVALMFYGKNIKDENSIITIYKYSQKYKNFISILFPKDKDLIYFKSYDTIKKTDKFYFLKFKKDNFFLKYSSDKYFDLKIITYNNDTLKILYNVDFKGYDTDKNPKYYEHLKLIEGMFLYPDITSLLTISTLNLERKNQYFLDKVELYTFN